MLAAISPEASNVVALAAEARQVVASEEAVRATDWSVRAASLRGRQPQAYDLNTRGLGSPIPRSTLAGC